MSHRHRNLSQSFIFNNDEAEAFYQNQQRVTSSSNTSSKGRDTAAVKKNTNEGINMNRPTEHELRYRNHFQTFPQKLHLILSSGGHDDVISWLEDGKSWIVHNKERFINELMPRYFESTKWKSFMRQVTGWGFKRNKYDTQSSSRGAYYLETFIEGRPDLASKIRRTHQLSNKKINTNEIQHHTLNGFSLLQHYQSANEAILHELQRIERLTQSFLPKLNIASDLMPLNQQYTIDQQSSYTNTENLSQMHRNLSLSQQKHNDTNHQISMNPYNDITTNLSQERIIGQQTSQRLEHAGSIPFIMNNKCSVPSMLSHLNQNPIFRDDLMKMVADMASFGNINTQDSLYIREPDPSHQSTSQHIHHDPALLAANYSNLLQSLQNSIRPMHVEQTFAQSHDIVGFNKLLSNLKEYQDKYNLRGISGYKFSNEQHQSNDDDIHDSKPSAK